MKKRSLLLSHRTVPVFLLLITIAGFGLLIPWLGFYWDDWAKILVSRLWGLGAYFRYYAEDRPLSSWTHIVFTPILGESPLPWHVFTLLLRWLSAWGMWWCLQILWPAARRQNLLAVLLFLIYPVFVSQPEAVTFHQQWLQFALFFLSLGAMLRAAQVRQAEPRKFALLTGLALLGQLLQLSVTEYFVPLEMVRLAAMWFLLAGEQDTPRKVSTQLVKTLRAAWPYLLVLALYVIWRLFFIQLSGEDPYRANTLYAFFQDPLGTLRATLLVALVDEIRILVTSWADLLYIQVTDASPFTLFSYGAGAAAGAAVLYYLLKIDAADEMPAQQAELLSTRWARQAFCLGLAAVLLGPLPAWITGRQVVFDFHSDRYAMPAIFGASLLLAALIEWLARRRVQVAVLASVLVALGVGLHLRVANEFRWVWEDQQRFFWQLTWRAPGLKGPTAIFLENEPFPNQGLFSTSAALNLLYPQPEGFGKQAGEGQLAYWVYTLRPRYNHAPDSMQIGLSTVFRTLRFQGETPASLLIYKNPARGNCIWVLRPEDAGHPDLPELVREFLPIANQSQIESQPTPGFPPEELIGAEPEHGWCYYYQKAALARQMEDWPKAAALADEALALGFAPDRSGSNAPFEWLPMIEGLNKVGRLDDAAKLTIAVHERDPRYAGMLCSLWQEGTTAIGTAEQPETVRDMQSRLGCVSR